jgi:hypothetical protein
LIGAGEPIYTLFKGRKACGVWSPSSTFDDDDLILTRILWLSGDEPENNNTYKRYIYIHGTNREDSLGQPSSHGCIRASNSDMLQLFMFAQKGTSVVIE